MARGLFWLSFLALGVGFVRSRSSGPPLVTDVCNNVRPAVFPNSPHNQQAGNGDYFVSTNIPVSTTPGSYNYTAGQTYTVQVQSRSANIFKGFLVQSQNPSGTTVGVFTTTNSVQQVLGCQTPFPSITLGSTVAHNSAGLYSTQTFNWTAPNSDGLVNFMYSVVRIQAQYFGPLSAAAQTQQPIVTEDPAMTAGPVTTASPRAAPQGITNTTRRVEDYRITARFPTDCVPSSCTVFVGIDTNTGNPNYLDIYVEGEAQAWIAVGFTETPSMFTADVVACNVNPNTNMVEALDTWNDGTGRFNDLDMKLEDVFLLSGAFTNGRISCRMVRKTAGTVENPIRDLNLDGLYHLLYGRGMRQRAGGLSSHVTGTGNPQISPEMVNPASDRANFGANPDRVRNGLTRAHGILMWIAWPFLASTGIFFAAYIRPALPNGEWFQVHRALMVTSLIVGAVGFMFIFIAQINRPIKGLIDLGRTNGTGTAHFVIGLIVMLLHIINPLIALCRCHPGTPKRWIFNAIHGYGIGLFAQSLAFTNVGLGIGIFTVNFSRFGGLSFFYLFVAYIVLFFIMSVILPCVFCHTNKGNCGKDGCKKEDKEKREKVDIELQGGPTIADKEDEAKPPKVPSKDAPLRWGVFTVYIVVLTCVTIAMIVLIAL